MGIKLTIVENPEFKQPEIILRCEALNHDLRKIVEFIRVRSHTIPVKEGGASTLLALSGVFYFESVDKKTFAYCASEVYECSESLAELERRLADTTFVRASKSCIVNAALIRSVKPLDNHRLTALMRNGERQIINRHYVVALKEKLGI